MVLGPNKQGRVSLSRKILLSRPSDSEGSDDNMHGPAALEKNSVHEQTQRFGNVSQAFDGLTVVEGSSSQPIGDNGLVSDSRSDSTEVTQPVGDADPVPKTIRSRLRSLYDGWFSLLTAAKWSRSQSVSDDTSGKSDSKTTKQ